MTRKQPTPPKLTLRLPLSETARAALRREFAAFFTVMLTPEKNWPAIPDDEFVEALADAMLEVGKRTGRGLPMLQVMVYELQDLINKSLHTDEARPEAQLVDVAIPSAEPSESSLIQWDDEANLNEDSPLSRLGYTVAEGAITLAQRRRILRDAVEKDYLPLTRPEEKTKWGKANSSQRVYAISKFIAWLWSFQGSDKPKAREKWGNDLNWLRENFYHPRMKFDWPVLALNDSPSKVTAKKRTPNAAFMEVLTPSAALASIVGNSPLPRTEVVSKLWAYVKKNKLQDAVNKRMINADAKLKKVFNKPQVSMFEMAGLIGKHLS